jgi:hypothetical protein
MQGLVSGIFNQNQSEVFLRDAIIQQVLPLQKDQPSSQVAANAERVLNDIM